MVTGTSSQESETLAHFLRRVREESGFSQEALATQLGRDQPWVSKTERGTRRIRLAEFLMWLDVLGLSVSEVADELDDLWVRRGGCPPE